MRAFDFHKEHIIRVDIFLCENSHVLLAAHCVAQPGNAILLYFHKSLNLLARDFFLLTLVARKIRTKEVGGGGKARSVQVYLGLS